MLDLDARLRKGPLPVGSLFWPERDGQGARRVLRARRRRVLASAVALGACLLLACVWLWPAARSAVPTRQAAPLAPLAIRRDSKLAEEPSPRVLFADGSSAEPRGKGSHIQTEELSARRIRLRLTGAARFEVAPRPERVFDVHSAEVVVRVLGTAFSVEPLGTRTRIAVEHGRVQVLWPSGEQTLGAGEVGTFPPAESAPARRPVAAVEARASVRGAGPEDLMLAADIARLNGQPDAAVAPLQQLIARFPRDKRAALAAFSLGRVLLDDLGRVAEAAAAFEQASLLAPSGPLAEGALARAVEACLQLGQRERAAKLAQRYLSRFARGTHAEAMRRMLAP